MLFPIHALANTGLREAVYTGIWHMHRTQMHLGAVHVPNTGAAIQTSAPRLLSLAAWGHNPHDHCIKNDTHRYNIVPDPGGHQPQHPYAQGRTCAKQKQAQGAAKG